MLNVYEYEKKKVIEKANGEIETEEKPIDSCTHKIRITVSYALVRYVEIHNAYAPLRRNELRPMASDICECVCVYK